MSTRVERAREIIRTAERKAFAWGLLPIPLVDAAAVTLVQLGMIRELAALYGVPYHEHHARPILTALLGSLVPTQLGTTVARSLMRHVPGVGPLLGALALPTSLGGATRVLGKLFAQHLENGGRVEDFDLDLDEALRASATNGPPRQPDGQDDLTRLEGIGPKIGALLHAAGIHTFAQLAEASVARLEEILRAAGPRFRMHDPASWPPQARLAAEGRWAELDALNRG